MYEQLGQPLDGLELDYTYEGGGQIIASFSHGRLKYRWLSGPFEGVEESGLNYQCRHAMRFIWSIGTTKTILISSRSSSIWRGKRSIRQRCSTTVGRT
jgi:hypothetical protein